MYGLGISSKLQEELFTHICSLRNTASVNMTSPQPSQHRALVLSSRTGPLAVRTVPTPEAIPGSAVVEILAAGVISYQREIYNGSKSHMHYTLPTPLVAGMSGKSLPGTPLDSY